MALQPVGANRVVRFLRDQPALVVAAVVALVTMFFVPPDAEYAGYFDVQVLGLLFCLMTCVAGLRGAGLFAWLASRVLDGERSMRVVSLALVALCFFSSMLITNDVALISFVPFTLYLFRVARRERHAAFVVIAQTLAANMGSMVTPIGNPQNLFLCSRFGIAPLELFGVVAPFAVLSFVLVAVGHVLVPRQKMGASLASEPADVNVPGAVVFGLLFVASALVVFDVVPLVAAFALVVVATLLFRRDTLLQVDYALLAMFACFFVISGNIARIEVVRTVLATAMGSAPFAVSLAASQVISNVPAAILLAPFTIDWPQLVLGVDIGGLGTPVASLASLISIQLYHRARFGSLSRFMVAFLAANFALLAANLALWAVL